MRFLFCSLCLNLNQKYSSILQTTNRSFITFISWKESKNKLISPRFFKMSRIPPLKIEVLKLEEPVSFSPREYEFHTYSLNLLSPSTASGSGRGPSPLPTPVSSSPPPVEEPSGFLQPALDALTSAVSKRGTKASMLSVDEDMLSMCYKYNKLTNDERKQFLIHIATKITTDHDLVKDVIAQRPLSKNDAQEGEILAALTRWEDRLKKALQSPHHWIASQVSRLPGGVKFLVDLRRDLLALQNTVTMSDTENSSVKSLDNTLKEMLSLWFTVGLLKLSRITWKNSSGDMLQKITEYEAVHPVRNVNDLRRRVGPYRRCYIFTHDCMPDEPLVVLHTYLTKEISKSMAGIVESTFESYLDPNNKLLIEEEKLDSITTAIFYSITASQKGLQGIELGHYMIKSVVKELIREFPNISQFSSLSPIPGFSKWLFYLFVRAQKGEVTIFTDEELTTLQKLFSSSVPELYSDLTNILRSKSWLEQPLLKKILEGPLTRMCAAYLYLEKRRGYAFDSVANFHLKNGSVMWRINWMADTLPRGLSNSCGLMVNYRYFLDDCETNSCQYLETAKIAASESVLDLVEKHKAVFKENIECPKLVGPLITID